MSTITVDTQKILDDISMSQEAALGQSKASILDRGLAGNEMLTHVSETIEHALQHGTVMADGALRRVLSEELRSTTVSELEITSEVVETVAGWVLGILAGVDALVEEFFGDLEGLVTFQMMSSLGMLPEDNESESVDPAPIPAPEVDNG